MKADEKYNQIIDRIEELVRRKPYKNTKEILGQIRIENGFFKKDREFNAIFEFISEQRALSYVLDRKLMYIYERLLKTNRLDTQSAIEIYGVSEQSSLINAFRKKFDVAPTTILKKRKNNEQIPEVEPPAHWGEHVRKVEAESSLERNKEEQDMHTVAETSKKYKPDKLLPPSETLKHSFFGVDRKSYEQVLEMLNLASEYGCSNICAEAGRAFSIKYNKPLDEAVKYAAQFEMDMDEVKEAYEDDPTYLLEQGINNLDEFYYDWITDDMTNEIMMHCYFDLGMDVSSSYDVVFRNGIETVDIKDLDKPHAFALSYTGDACSAYEAMEMADHFIERSNSEQIDYARFASFMDYILRQTDALIMPDWDLAYIFSEPFDWREMEKYADCSDDQQDLFEARLDEDEERREGWYYSGNLNEDSDENEDEINRDDDYWDFMSEEDEY